MIGINPSPHLSADWIEDSTHWWGKPLRGPGGHWCPEYDYLPIDASCFEALACSCKPEFCDAVSVLQIAAHAATAESWSWEYPDDDFWS